MPGYEEALGKAAEGNSNNTSEGINLDARIRDSSDIRTVTIASTPEARRCTGRRGGVHHCRFLQAEKPRR